VPPRPGPDGPKMVRVSVCMTASLAERVGRAVVMADLSKSEFICAVLETALADLPSASDADLEAMEAQQDAAANWRSERGLR
jgi:hypothetical protein